MTAIGVFLMVIGVVVMNAWGSPIPLPAYFNKADKIGAGLLTFGCILTLIGVCTFLWRWLP